MNRAQRRQSRRYAPPKVRALAAAYQCPDCLSENGVPFQDSFGIWHLNVHHDDTCPTYRRLKAEGSAT